MHVLTSCLQLQFSPLSRAIEIIVRYRNTIDQHQENYLTCIQHDNMYIYGFCNKHTQISISCLSEFSLKIWRCVITIHMTWM